MSGMVIFQMDEVFSLSGASLELLRRLVPYIIKVFRLLLLFFMDYVFSLSGASLELLRRLVPFESKFSFNKHVFK